MNFTREDIAAHVRLLRDSNGALSLFTADLLEAVAAAGGWQPIEAAPKDGSVIVVWSAEFDDNHGRFLAYWCPDADEDETDFNGEGAWYEWPSSDVLPPHATVTLWAALPAPPEAAPAIALGLAVRG